MKQINIYSLISTFNSFSAEIFEAIKNHKGIEIKKGELEDLGKLALTLYEQDVFDLSGFYIGYKIPQINCEFDLLRIGEKSIINIELKRKLDPIKAKKQLADHMFYLNFLDKEIYCFTYVAEDGELYTINDQGDFISTSLSVLIDKLKNQDLKTDLEIDELFRPSKFLVSPFNSTRSFLEDRYILTEHQQNIKKEVIDFVTNDVEEHFIGIKGDPGTGKTLLTYDIAKELIKNDKQVLIVHCAELNIGHHRLNKQGKWDIKSISEFSNYINALEKYDVIIFDECQRNRKDQFYELISNVEKLNIKCIFSYDPHQCFTDAEFRRKIPEIIEHELEAKIFVLTNTIRINYELSSFINNLFDKSKVNSKMLYKNIDIIYFNNEKLAKGQTELLLGLEWESLNYTGSKFGQVKYDRYQLHYNPNVHKVIGQEFDNVIGVIDEHFYYNQDGLLSSERVPNSAGYNMDKMLYQILTRARQKITLIIINNKPLYKECMKILGIYKSIKTK